jgi:hypothetical protein
VTVKFALSEKELQNAIVSLARTLGYRVAHFRPAMMRSGRWATPMQGDAGFPDLVLVGRGKVLFVELKTKDGRLTDEQVAWGDAIGMAGANWKVWRPADWPDVIQAELEATYEQIRGDKPELKIQISGRL